MKLYAFSTLIQVLEVSPSFIRRLEKAEVIIPVVEGSKTFYTEHDMRKLLLAKELREMGINLAGIEVILDMSEHIQTIRKETDEILYNLLKFIQQNIKEENKRRR
ncbi:MAG TPA: MerR family transcriptional regulator [Thermodesulfobacteriota bacterium]|jgi:MerR family transcriptional regulator/heat shock protein HspR